MVSLSGTLKGAVFVSEGIRTFGMPLGMPARFSPILPIILTQSICVTTSLLPVRNRPQIPLAQSEKIPDKVRPPKPMSGHWPVIQFHRLPPGLVGQRPVNRTAGPQLAWRTEVLVLTGAGLWAAGLSGCFRQYGMLAQVYSQCSGLFLKCTLCFGREDEKLP